MKEATKVLDKIGEIYFTCVQIIFELLEAAEAQKQSGWEIE
jgi:hypothetical protein